MSSYEKTEYFMEAAGFENGPEIIIGSLLAVSIICGALIANCMLNKEGDSETKQARKALADVLNKETKGIEQFAPTSDDMFDVPLNDERSYHGPDLADAAMLTSETSYMQAASKPGQLKAKPVTTKQSAKKSRSKYNNVKVGNLTEDEEYSFDVDVL